MNEETRNRLLSLEPGKPVLEALNELLGRDGYLLEMDVNERSIVHRFALHLQTFLPKWHVDCEYNRDGVEPKRIEYLALHPDAEDTEAKTVYPDIIAHIRGSDANYLVIEVKKSTNSVPREIDLAKLRGYKRDLGYRFALFLELRVGAGTEVSRAEWVDA